MKIELLDNEKDWFLDHPQPLSPAKYASIAILRRTEDYAAFRTEADKYTNSVATPAHSNTSDVIERALILASKQKAVERRHQNRILRDFVGDEECYLKDNLCLKCPTCILNGGIRAEKGLGEISIKSRVLYQTAFSILPFETVVESITFNAVDEVTTKTGQALGERELVKPDTYFLSVVSILAPTLDELKFYLFSMLQTTRYGAESRGFGILDNKLLSIVLSDSEEFSALGLTMDLYENLVSDGSEPMKYPSILDTIHSVSLPEVTGSGIRKSYTKDEVQNIEKTLRSSAPTKTWINGMYKTAGHFRDLVISGDKKKQK
ncbi:MAG: type I-D CRISPR-associated protein Cas7/Csc2 [Candidatus Thorarchaeota archaeon]